MATRIKQAPENRDTRRISLSISGPAYIVALGGASRGSNPKTGKITGEEHRITPRYLTPPIGSCHDLCKHGLKDEFLELKGPSRRFGSRKMSVVKDNGAKRTVIPVERNKITITKPKPTPDPKIRAPDKPVEVKKRENSLPSRKTGVSNHSLLTNGKSTQHEENMAKKHVKAKPVSSSIENGSPMLNSKKNKKERVMPKATRTGSLPRNHKLMSPPKEQSTMTKTKLKKLIAEKVEEIKEMTLHEAETTELELVTPSILATESTNLPSPESSQSSSEKQVSNLEPEHSDDKEVLEEESEYANDEEVIISEDDYEMETSEGNFRYRVVICEDKENGGFKVKFRRGRVVELQSGGDGPKKLKFRRGKVVEDNGEELSIQRINFKKKIADDDAGNDYDCCSETVTLKHQQVQKKKEAQDLLNRIIEETASKLVEDRKTRVGALVGAFETVISSRGYTHTPPE